jgi:hypothetical protein
MSDEVLSQSPFLGHSDLLENAAGSDVVRMVSRADPVKMQVSKSELDDKGGRLRSESLAP